jgi:hypothetical protein
MIITLIMILMMLMMIRLMVTDDVQMVSAGSAPTAKDFTSGRCTGPRVAAALILS